jgi:hypothetical protein
VAARLFICTLHNSSQIQQHGCPRARQSCGHPGPAPLLTHIKGQSCLYHPCHNHSAISAFLTPSKDRRDCLSHPSCKLRHRYILVYHPQSHYGRRKNNLGSDASQAALQFLTLLIPDAALKFKDDFFYIYFLKKLVQDPGTATT